MDTQDVTERLEAERHRLQEARRSLADDGVEESEQLTVGELASVDQHDADLAGKHVERETGQSILGQLEAELLEAERALKRVDAGTYGTCEVCGKPIGEARLEVLPTARFCVEDQATQEREARPAR